MPVLLLAPSCPAPSLLGIVDGDGVVFAMDVGGGGLVMAAW